MGTLDPAKGGKADFKAALRSSIVRVRRVDEATGVTSGGKVTIAKPGDFVTYDEDGNATVIPEEYFKSHFVEVVENDLPF